MINRILIRIKIIQILYSYYNGGEKSLPQAERELIFSFDKAYELYFHLLALSLRITEFAAARIDIRKNKFRPTTEDLNPNTTFVDNLFIKQLSVNQELDEFLKRHKLSWAGFDEVIKNLYEEIEKSDFFINYMNSQISDYEKDKEIWKKIFR
jgi:N utilization substance protein B